MSARSSPISRSAGLFVALFLSGAAALVYETTWGRLLHQVFGVSDLAVATVLATFFLGLGLGSAVGARLAVRIRRHALGYAALEVGIAACALLSLVLIPGVHGWYRSLATDAGIETLSAIRFVLALVILLPPTLMMGATLPLLIALVAGDGDWSRRATALYAVNTLGAVAGAGVTGFWLLPGVGMRLSIVLAAGASLTAGAIVAAGWGSRAREEAGTTPATPPAPSAADADGGAWPRLAMALAAAAGFTALAGEVLWTRLLRIVLQGTTEAFAAMLMNFLAGIAIGSAAADRWGRRVSSPVRAFGLAQAAAAACVALAMLITPHLPRLLGLLRGQADLEPHEAWIQFALSTVLLFPLALAVGAAVPLAWRIAGGDAERAGAHSGRVLAANTLGGLLGSLAAGFAFLPWLGTEASLIAVLLLHLIIATVALGRAAAPTPVGRAAWASIPVGIAAIVLAAGPSVRLPFLLHARYDPVNAILHGPVPGWEERLLYLREGRNTTVSLLADGDTTYLCNDGRQEGGITVREPGFGAELALLGSLPGLFADTREHALMVGLGAGHTTTVLLGGPWQRIDVVELEEAVVEAARVLHERAGKPFPLDDPRCRLFVDDARARLALAPPASLDAVVSQPSHPWLAGSSALYTREFFAEVRRVLRPGGVLALWVNLFRMDETELSRVVGTLCGEFPSVRAFVAEPTSFILCASTAHRPLDERLARRLAGDSGALRWLGPHGWSGPADLVACIELDEGQAAAWARGSEPVVDDRPSLEYRLARLPSRTRLQASALDESMKRRPWLSGTSWSELPAEERVPSALARIRRVHARRTALVRVQGLLDDAAVAETERRVLEGALAQAVGDVEAALTRYDASGTPEGAARADELRAALGAWAQALEVATSRKIDPARTAALLNCAAGLQSESSARAALAALARAGDSRLEGPREQVLAAWAKGGPAAVLALGPVAWAAAESSEEFAFLVERCALGAGDLDAGRRAAALAARHQALQVAAAVRTGMDCAAGDNLGGAVFHFRRALARDPAHAGAATALARVLCRMQRYDEASKVLHAAQEARPRSDSDVALLAATARELGLTDGAPRD